MILRYLVLSVILWVFITEKNLHAQFYSTGQPPASVKWKQINTGRHRLIFPESFESQATGVATLLQESWELTGHTLSHEPGRIPVVVHNHNARSNGLVVWAPKRMELYTTPPQVSRGGDWLTQLAVHEQRHVVQVDKLNQGITRILSFFLGEQAVGITAGLVPRWFLEGDAVTAETLLTRSGRGRMPSFDMPLRTLLMSRDEIYSYDKFILGSYKDYVPDHYQYGYRMVSSLRREYGPEIWENALDFTARRPYYISPFTISLRRDTGKKMSRIHKTVLAGARKEWDSLSHDRPQLNKNVINRRTDPLYHSYRYPVWAGDSAVIAHKSGIGRNDEFVTIDMKGNEKSLHFPGRLSSPSVTLSGSRLAWSEFKPDPRWRQRQYSVIRVFDLSTGREKRITSRSRFFAPAFAPDGLSLAVVEVDLQNRNFILLLNSVTGEVTGQYQAPAGKNLQQPAFHPLSNEILLTSVCEKGTAIVSLDRETGQWEELMQPSYVTVSGLFPCGEMVCFHSDMAGIDNLFALDRKDGSIYQLTGSGFGAFDGSLSASGDRLIWSDYTADGFDLTVADFEVGEPDLYNGALCLRDEVIRTLVSCEKGIVRGDIQDSTRWEAEPYKKVMNLFRFHSWSPFYFDYSDFNLGEQPVLPGLTLLSQNLLNTANTMLGYSYSEGNHVAHGRFVYKGWYPVFEAGLDYGDEPMITHGRDIIGMQEVPSSGQLNLHSAVYLPLNFSAGRYIAGVEPRLGINYDNSLYHHEREDEFKRGMTTIDTRFLAYRYSRRSHRDLAPPWGQVFRWRRLSAPFESENLGVINAVELTLYFPGFYPHHTLRFDGALQRQDPVKYYYSGIAGFPRGYSRETSEKLEVLKSSYLFPLIYPEVTVPGIFYLKRVHAQLFADIGMNRFTVIDQQTGRSEWQKEQLFSWGGTLTANFHFLRILFPFNMSTGFARIPGREETSFLFSLGVDLDIF